MSAHGHLIASYTDFDDFLFITLHSGHQIYGYTSEAGWINYQCPDVYPEDHTPEYWAEELGACEDWTEAIRDIPALYGYYEPY
jgi:hypothetical protein